MVGFRQAHLLNSFLLSFYAPIYVSLNILDGFFVEKTMRFIV